MQLYHIFVYFAHMQDFAKTRISGETEGLAIGREMAVQYYKPNVLVCGINS